MKRITVAILAGLLLVSAPHAPWRNRSRNRRHNRNHNLGRRKRSAPSCRSRPAPAPTSSRAWFSTSSRTSSGSRSWSRIAAALPYDTADDFAAVAPFGNLPTALVMSPSKGIRTVQELVAAAKAKPGSLTYASAGVGSTTHLTAERFRLSAGFEAVHVPFRGGGFRPEVSSGRVDFAFSPIAVALSDIRDGRLVVLAVSGPQRSPVLPDVPTTLEAGYANSDYVLWLGMFVPRLTRREIVDRLHQETVKALRNPSLRERLIGLDVQPMDMTPPEFDAFIKQEIVVNGELAKAAGLKQN